MKKKILSVAIMVAIIISLFPMTSLAKYQRILHKEGGMTWDVSEGEAKLVEVSESFNGTIPSIIKEGDRTYKVRSITTPIKWNNTSVKKIKLPDTILYVDAEAFRDATNIVAYETYPAYTLCDSLIYLKSDQNGLLYLSYEMYGNIANSLIAYPNGKKDDELVLIHHTVNIEDNALKYCQYLSEIKRIVIQDGDFSYDYMYDKALASIAMNENGKCDYSKLTMVLRDFSIEEGDEKYDDIDGGENYIENVDAFKYAYSVGMKIDAFIGHVRVRDLVYKKNGKYKIVLKYGDEVKLKEGKDYELKIYKDSNPLCLRDIEVFGIDGGVFENQSMLTSQFIKPHRVKKLKVHEGKDGVILKWKADKTVYGKCKYITGYQIGIGTDEFDWLDEEPERIIYVKGYRNTKKIIKNLKNEESYYIAVRSYKKVEGQEVCGSWSYSQYYVPSME